jgi:hypothetical protein
LQNWWSPGAVELPFASRPGISHQRRFPTRRIIGNLPLQIVAKLGNCADKHPDFFRTNFGQDLCPILSMGFLISAVPAGGHFGQAVV